MTFNDLIWNMKLALEEAENAYHQDEVPVGALIINSDGHIVSKAFNLKEKNHNPTHHAEILAISKACETLQSWRLCDHMMFVTLEPCPMCMSALVQARISHLYFGAYDPKGGSLSLGLNLHQNPALNHQFSVTGGIEHLRSSKLLSTFFKEKRTRFKAK